MTSRNSFWANMKENNKRRIWLWLISALGFLVALPTGTAFTISRGMTSKDHYYEMYGDVLGEQKITEYLMSRVQELLGFDTIMWLFVAAFAIVSAIQGFSYLYNRRKIDFYMGMPVKRSKRFFMIWLNGIIVYLVPYFLGILLSCLIAMINGVINGEIFLEAMQAYGMYFCFYLGVYHLTILAVMMTGNMIITCFAVAVFFLYELTVRWIIQTYMELFYKLYSWYGYESVPIFSPFAILFRFTDNVNNQNAGAQGAPGMFQTIVYLLLFAAVIGGISYLCYLKRPAEAAGKAMAFSMPKPWIKILIAVPVTLLAGILVSDIVGYRPMYGEGNIGYIVFSMAVVLLVTCCLIQVIYEFDIRGILHKKRHIVISAVITVFIFAVFKYDLTGYDSYMPKTEQVESVAFVPPMDSYSYYGESYFNENMETMSRYEYMTEYMYLTDVGTVNKLMKKFIEAADEMESLNELYDREEDEWYQVIVTYRMNNKRTVSRRIFVNLNDPETVELLDRIETSEEFIAGAYMGASDILDRAVSEEKYRISAVYGNGIYEQKLSQEDTKELLARYKKDITKTGFVQQRESIPMGSLIINLERQMENYTVTNQSELKIYPFFEECISYLQEKGYYMERFINSEDIDRIQVINYNHDVAEAMEKAQKEADVMSAGELLHAQAHAEETVSVLYGYDSDSGSQIDVRKHATYEDAAEIEQIAQAIYPMGWISNSWHMNQESDENYVVTVYFKPDTAISKNYGGVTEYCFLVDQVPDFVEADTAYIE